MYALARKRAPVASQSHKQQSGLPKPLPEMEAAAALLHRKQGWRGKHHFSALGAACSSRFGSAQHDQGGVWPDDMLERFDAEQQAL